MKHLKGFKGLDDWQGVEGRWEEGGCRLGDAFRDCCCYWGAKQWSPKALAVGMKESRQEKYWGSKLTHFWCSDWCEGSGGRGGKKKITPWFLVWEKDGLEEREEIPDKEQIVEKEDTCLGSWKMTQRRGPYPWPFYSSISIPDHFFVCNRPHDLSSLFPQ